MSDADQDPRARRQRLVGAANPARRDYVVELSGRLGGTRPAAVRLRYVPDRLVLDADSFARYLAYLAACGWPGLEALAAGIADDVGNEIVPRWSQVSVTAEESGGLEHAVLLEDRQPNWDNPALLARLRLW